MKPANKRLSLHSLVLIINCFLAFELIVLKPIRMLCYRIVIFSDFKFPRSELFPYITSYSPEATTIAALLRSKNSKADGGRLMDAEPDFPAATCKRWKPFSVLL